MVVGMVSGQNTMPMPKRQEPQKNDTQSNFDNLMQDKINAGKQPDKPKAPKAEEKPSDEKPISDRPVDTRDEQNVDGSVDKKAAAQQAMAAMLANLVTNAQQAAPQDATQTTAQPVIEQSPLVTADIATTATSTATVDSLQKGMASEAVQEFIMPNQEQKVQDKNGIQNARAANGKEGDRSLQTAKLPFEEIVDGNQETKIQTVQATPKTEDIQKNLAQGEVGTDKTAQTLVDVSAKNTKIVTDGSSINVAGQPVVQTLDPEKVNIKVGEAVDTKSEAFVEDFTDRIVVKIKQDIKEFDIQLDPQNMGKISIKVVFAAEKAFISMNCENAKTQSLLAQSSDAIRSIIQQNVGKDTVVVIQENQPQPQNYEQQHSQEQEQEQNEQQQQNRLRQIRSDDTQTFINQLRLGLVEMTSER